MSADIPEAAEVALTSLYKMQNILFAVTEENFEKNASTLKRSKYSKTDPGIKILSKEILRVIEIRHKKSKLYAHFIIKVFENIPTVKTYLMKSLYGESITHQQKVAHLRVLRKLYKLKYLTIQEIWDEYRSFPRTNQTQLYLYFMAFGYEFEHAKFEDYNDFLKEIVDFKLVAPSLIEECGNDMSCAFASPIGTLKWEPGRHLVMKGFPKNSIEYAIKYNDAFLTERCLLVANDPNKLVKKSPFDPVFISGLTCTAAQLAASYGSIDALLAIMKLKADYRKPDQDGHSFQDYAAIGGNVEIIDMCEARLLDISNILHLCAKSCNLEAVRFLFNRLDDKKPSDDQIKLALLEGTKNGNAKIVKLAIEHGASPKSKDEDKRTPLHLAAMYNSLPLCKIFLMLGCDVNAIDIHGQTPLHLATESRNIEIIQYLVSVEGIDVNIKDNYGLTPFEIASPTKKPLFRSPKASDEL